MPDKVPINYWLSKPYWMPYPFYADDGFGNLIELSDEDSEYYLVKQRELLKPLH